MKAAAYSLVLLFAFSRVPLSKADNDRELKNPLRAVVVRVGEGHRRTIYDTEALFAARTASSPLFIPERAMNPSKYFERVVRPKLVGLENEYRLKFTGVRPFYYGHPKTKIELEGKEWDDYVEKTKKEFPKDFELKSGRDFHHEFFLIYDLGDKRVRVNRKLLLDMQAAGATVDLAAADLHMALYLWELENGAGGLGDASRTHFDNQFSRLVAHLFTNDSASEVADRYGDGASRRVSERDAVEIESYELGEFVPHGAGEKEVTEAKFKAACDKWTSKMNDVLSDDSTIKIKPHCVPNSREGVYQYEALASNGGRYLHASKGTIVAFIGKAKIVPKMNHLVVERFIPTELMPAGGPPREEPLEMTYNELFEAFSLCKNTIEQFRKSEGAFTLVAYCGRRNSYVPILFGVPTGSITNGKPQVSEHQVAAYYVVDMLQVLVSKRKIVSREQEYKASRRWSDDDQYGSMLRITKDLASRYGELEETERRRFGANYLTGISQSQQWHFTKMNLSADHSAETTAQFIHLE